MNPIEPKLLDGLFIDCFRREVFADFERLIHSAWERS